MTERSGSWPVIVVVTCVLLALATIGIAIELKPAFQAIMRFGFPEAVEPYEPFEPYEHALLPLDFTDDCSQCGAGFTIDSIELRSHDFLIHLTVRNTGQVGNLQYSPGTAYALDTSQAERFLLADDEARVGGHLVPLLREQLGSESHVVLRSTPDVFSPTVLEPGTEWTGWIRFNKRLPAETVGLVIAFFPRYRDEHPPWFSSTDKQPYLAIPR